MDALFDVVWSSDKDVVHSYTFTTEQEALLFMKELESKGYESNIVEWSSE